MCCLHNSIPGILLSTKNTMMASHARVPNHNKCLQEAVTCLQNHLLEVFCWLRMVLQAGLADNRKDLDKTRSTIQTSNSPCALNHIGSKSNQRWDPLLTPTKAIQEGHIHAPQPTPGFPKLSAPHALGHMTFANMPVLAPLMMLIFLRPSKANIQFGPCCLSQRSFKKICFILRERTN